MLGSSCSVHPKSQIGTYHAFKFPISLPKEINWRQHLKSAKSCQTTGELHQNQVFVSLWLSKTKTLSSRYLLPPSCQDPKNNQKQLTNHIQNLHSQHIELPISKSWQHPAKSIFRKSLENRNRWMALSWAPKSGISIYFEWSLWKDGWCPSQIASWGLVTSTYPKRGQKWMSWTFTTRPFSGGHRPFALLPAALQPRLELGHWMSLGSWLKNIC